MDALHDEETCSCLLNQNFEFPMQCRFLPDLRVTETIHPLQMKGLSPDIMLVRIC
jgi:hypothetical protein